MSAALARMDLSLSWERLAAIDLGTAKVPGAIRKILDFTNGTALAGSINNIYVANISLAANASTTIDLNGAINNALGGGTFDFAKIKLMYLDFPAGDAQSSLITVGPNGSQGFNGPLVGNNNFALPNGSFFIHGLPTIAGMNVTSTTDKVKITNSDATSGRNANLTILFAGV